MTKSVVLITPPLSLEDRYGKDMMQFGAVTEPLGLAYIAGYLESNGIPVRLIDSPVMDMSMEDIIEDIVSSQDEIVGISVLTPAFGIVKKMCENLKKKYPKGIIVLGGPHCTALPERTLKEIKWADIVCIGEGEITLAQIAMMENDSDLEQVKGICFQKNDVIIRNQDRPFIKNLDEIPPTARHLLHME